MVGSSSLLLLAAGCAFPARPAALDMDLRDAGFRGPADRDRAAEILKKDEITVDDALRIADLLNPRLEALRGDINLAPLAAWDASLFPNPRLEFEVEEFPASGGRSLGHAERGFGLAQEIPLGGRLSAASSVSGKAREAAALRYLWKRRAILTDVKKAFVDVLAARGNADLTRRTRDLAKEFHDLADERFRSQAIPEMELLKAAVNLARAESDVRLAEAALAVAIKRLHALLGDVDYPAAKFAGDLAVRFETPSLETLRGQALAGHPRIELAGREKELAELELDLESARAIPDLDVSVSYRWTPDEEHIVEGGVSLPLPVFNRNQAAIETARIRLRQGELGIQDARNEALLSLEEAWHSFIAAQDRADAYRETILPKAEKALQQTDEGYRAGKFSYLDVLDAQQTLAGARIAYLSALQDLNRLAADLEKVTGSNLRRIR